MANPMSKEEKQWVFVTIMFAVIIFLSFYFLYFKKANLDLDRIAKEKDALQVEVDKYQKIAEGPDTQTRIKELQASIDQFEQRLPNEKEVPKLLDFLREAADAADIQYTSIIAKPPVPGTFYIEIPFDVVLMGKYHNIGHVVNQIENSTRLLKVDNIDLSAGKGIPIQHTLRFKMVTYVYNPNQPIADKGQETPK